jgi:hypothetical protein
MMSHAHHSIPGFEVDVIDQLYAELAELYAKKESAPADRRLDIQITETFQRLRTAQADEVVRLRSSFESGLRMPLGAGAELLRQVRRMRGSLEDPAAGDHASSAAYDTKA